MVRVYTRTGDKGTTALFDGSRVPKDDLRVETYGTVDELNSQLSLARLATDHEEVRTAVRAIQRFLFVLGADLATPAEERSGKSDGSASHRVRRVGDDDVAGLEAHIDTFWARITETKSFVVPGETLAAAHFHVARTICRRAERLAVHLADQSAVGDPVVAYLNRLSDLLFTWGRFEDEGVAEADRIHGLGDTG